MDNKYYINENGLITLVQSISNSVIQHTSGEINFTTDPNTGEKQLDKPNNFPTVKAVTDYLKNRNKLKFVYDVNSKLIMQSYDTVEHQKEYNGENEVQIDIKLITADDIKNLF